MSSTITSTVGAAVALSGYTGIPQALPVLVAVGQAAPVTVLSDEAGCWHLSVQLPAPGTYTATATCQPLPIMPPPSIPEAVASSCTVANLFPAAADITLRIGGNIGVAAPATVQIGAVSSEVKAAADGSWTTPVTLADLVGSVPISVVYQPPSVAQEPLVQPAVVATTSFTVAAPASPPPPPVVTTGNVMAPTLIPTDPAAITTFEFVAFSGAATPANTVTFATPLPDGVLRPTDGVAIGGVPAQMDAASTHPSGFVKHALMSVAVPPLAAGQTWVGSLTKAGRPNVHAPTLACSVTVTVTPAGGAAVYVDLGAAFRSGPVDLFRFGSLVTEGRVRVPVPGLDHLEVVADLQCFADGTHRIDVIFARETVNIVAMPSAMPVAPTLTYAASIADAGAPVYSAASVRHDMGQRWTPTFGTGLTQPIHVQFDPAFLRATGAMIHDPSVGVAPSALACYVAQAVAPMTVVSGTMNGITQYMGQTGGREDIGPEPTAVAAWLITQDPKIAQYCLWQAEAARTIPWHWRDAATGSYMSITDHPTLWWPPAQGQGAGHAGPDVVGAGLGGWAIDNAHEPDTCFMPWLLTGRRAHYDDVMAQATEQVYWLNPASTYRNGGAGQILAYNTTSYQTQVRAQAWIIRQLAQAAAYAMDGDRLRAHVATWTNTNLDALAAFLPALATNEGELACWVPGTYGTANMMAPWQQDYLACAMATANSLGFVKARTILDAMTGFLAGCMLTPDYFPRDCCVYNLPVGPIDAPTTRTWAGAKAVLAAAGGSGIGGCAPNTFRPYYAARRGVLEYMAARGNDQAQRALAWLLSVASATDVTFGATDGYAATDPTFFIS